MNVMMLLEMASGAFPDRPAFTDGERDLTYTYSELFEAARQRAGAIQAQGSSRMAKLDVSNLGTPLGSKIVNISRRAPRAGFPLYFLL